MQRDLANARCGARAARSRRVARGFITHRLGKSEKGEGLLSARQRSRKRECYAVQALCVVMAFRMICARWQEFQDEQILPLRIGACAVTA
jgi:hypothetical protein